MTKHHANTGRKNKKAQTTSTCNSIVIRAAVTYAQAVAAHEAGFRADPEADNVTAARTGDRYSNISNAALEKLASAPALSAEALDAKARIVALIIDDDAGVMEERSEAFYRSFASDVRKFLEPIIREHWLADVEARKAKAA